MRKRRKTSNRRDWLADDIASQASGSCMFGLASIVRGIVRGIVHEILEANAKVLCIKRRIAFEAGMKFALYNPGDAIVMLKKVDGKTRLNRAFDCYDAVRRWPGQAAWKGRTDRGDNNGD